MWVYRKNDIQYVRRFFRLGLGYTNLADYYTNLWILSSKHGYSMSDLYDMMPYERDVFVDLIIDDIDKKVKESQQNKLME